MEVIRHQPHESDVAARLASAAAVLQREAEAILDLAKNLGPELSIAIDAISLCRGQVVVCGMGKAGLIGQKISATMASTGTRSIFLHPAEAVHGDLGRVAVGDVVLVLSYSGETEELTRVLPMLKEQAGYIIAITGSRQSTLGSFADVVLPLGRVPEACHLGLAPSASTTAMLAMGDTLALLASQARGFTKENFARFHPAGNLGRKLTAVDQVMRPLSTCRVVQSSLSVCDALVAVSQPGRRSGAVLLLDDEGRLAGIFTDSDLAKLLERKLHTQLDEPIERVMTRRFRTIASGASLSEAIHILATYKISELPVINHENRPLGLIDITDVMSLVSQEPETRDSTSAIHGARCVGEDGSLISVPLLPRQSSKG